jgi:hypothetical protein
MQSELEVSTLLGSPESKASEDGRKHSAKLLSPVNMAINYELKTIYFLEFQAATSTTPAHSAVRSYSVESMIVTTICSWFPIGSPGDICVIDNSTLFVTDSGANCVWKIDVNSGEIINHISSDHIKVSNEAVSSQNSGAASFVFSPLSIVQSNEDNCLYIGDKSGAIYRYVEYEEWQRIVQEISNRSDWLLS